MHSETAVRCAGDIMSPVCDASWSAADVRLVKRRVVVLALWSDNRTHQEDDWLLLQLPAAASRRFSGSLPDGVRWVSAGEPPRLERRLVPADGSSGAGQMST